MKGRHLLLPVIGFLILLLLAACGGRAETTVTTTRVVTEMTVQASQPVEVTRVVTETAVEKPVQEASPLPTFAPTSQPEPTRAAVMPAATAPPPSPQPTQTVSAPETTVNNPFTNTSEDHFSTFAVDVDTGAYTMMRQYVQAGRLPPAESVRVEEYVNYFNQDYEPPADTAFAIYADGAPSPFANDNSHILRVGIQGYEIPADQRQPAALTFVIDTSGSMGQANRLGLVKQSLQLLVGQLGPDDTVSIVTYGSNARVELEPTSDQTAILKAINGLRSGGSTNAEAGLVLGYKMANQGFRPEGINRVILTSDGVANVGATTAEAILERIRREAEGGITLTTVGVGMGNYNDQLMEQLADNGQGQYAFVDSLAEARTLFVTDLMNTLQTIALDAKVQVDFNPEAVTEYRLLGYENREVADQDFRNDAVDAGEIGAGHAVTALYAVRLAPEGNGRIATIQLRWQDPETYLVQEINHNVNTWDLAASFDSADERYQLAVVVAQYAELLRQSPGANEVTFTELHDHAVRLAERLSYDPDTAEFANLIVWATQASGASIANAEMLPANWGSITTTESESVASGTAGDITTTMTRLVEETARSNQPPLLFALIVVVAGGAVVWRQVSKQRPFPDQTASPPTPSQHAQAQVTRARQYQRQMKKLVTKQGKSAFASQLREMMAEFERWDAHLTLLVKRLVDFENNTLLQQDFAAVPRAVQQIKAQIEAESRQAVRRQLETTLTGYQEHQKQLESLTTLMRRTQLQLDSTVTAMGTIYSQLQLLVAMDIDSGRAKRLTHEIEEEVLRLNDLLTAVDELSQLRPLPSSHLFEPVLG